MRCKDVQKQLAIDPEPARLSGRVCAHLQTCADCRRMQCWFAGLDRELRENLCWLPPQGFAEHTALQACAMLPTRPRMPHRALQPFEALHAAACFRPLVLGFVTAMLCWVVLANGSSLTQAYAAGAAALSDALAAHVGSLAWTSSILSLCLSAWLTRRALRS